MTPTQRRYLEHAVRCEGGEFRWSVRSGGAEGAMHRTSRPGSSPSTRSRWPGS